MKLKQTGNERKVPSVITKEYFLKTACLFFCVVGILTVTLIRSECIRWPEGEKKILITAHRGASYGTPENTGASVRLAIAESADYAEVDVRMTADGVPVLMHDRALFRTTGIMNEIERVTYEELTSYDVGERYGAAFAGETVPALREILERYGQKIKFNIELKGGEHPELVREVVGLIEEYGLENRCLISSDSYEQLKRVKQMNRKIQTGYIMSLVYGEIYGYADADFFSIKSANITEQMVKSVHAQGKEIHAWTVNKEYEILRMQALGVDNIITDMPAYVRKILR